MVDPCLATRQRLSRARARLSPSKPASQPASPASPAGSHSLTRSLSCTSILAFVQQLSLPTTTATSHLLRHLHRHHLTTPYSTSHPPSLVTHNLPPRISLLPIPLPSHTSSLISYPIIPATTLPVCLSRQQESTPAPSDAYCLTRAHTSYRRTGHAQQPLVRPAATPADVFSFATTIITSPPPTVGNTQHALRIYNSNICAPRSHLLRLRRA